MIDAIHDEEYEEARKPFFATITAHLATSVFLKYRYFDVTTLNVTISYFSKMHERLLQPSPIAFWLWQVSKFSRCKHHIRA